MNVKRIKKVVIRIGIELVCAFVIAFTVTFIVAKAGDSSAGRAVRSELSQQREENRKLRGINTSLEGQHAVDAEYIKELEAVEQRLGETTSTLERLLRERRVNDTGAEEDIEELGELLQRDRDTVSRIRKLLQDKDSEDSDN